MIDNVVVVRYPQRRASLGQVIDNGGWRSASPFGGPSHSRRPLLQNLAPVH